MRKPLEYKLRLPKNVKIDDIDIRSIPLDESWPVTVKEGDRTIGEMSLATARVKFGRGERHA